MEPVKLVLSAGLLSLCSLGRWQYKGLPPLGLCSLRRDLDKVCKQPPPPVPMALRLPPHPVQPKEPVLHLSLGALDQLPSLSPLRNLARDPTASKKRSPGLCLAPVCVSRGNLDSQLLAVVIPDLARGLGTVCPGLQGRKEEESSVWAALQVLSPLVPDEVLEERWVHGPCADTP